MPLEDTNRDSDVARVGNDFTIRGQVMVGGALTRTAAVGTTTWPRASPGINAPAPPQATKARQPRAMTSSMSPAASGAPTPG